MTTTPGHVHTYREHWHVWDGHQQCRTWYCTTCPLGEVSSRIIPIGEGVPDGFVESAPAE